MSAVGHAALTAVFHKSAETTRQLHPGPFVITMHRKSEKETYLQSQRCDAQDPKWA